MKKQASYTLAMFLSIADVIGMVGLIYLASTQIGDVQGNKVFLILEGIGVLILFLLFKPLESYRRRARTATQYDSYGRMKSMNAYDKLSVQEQRELDKVRMMEQERILPYTVVREMTHKGSENPEEDMRALVGMGRVKEKMEEMEARMEFDQESGTSRTGEPMHMCFFGPPGTGKTTCARIMTGFLYKYGYIPENRLIEVNGGFLSDQYAEKKVEAIVQRAFGGVLFIDEAYSMLGGAFGPDAVAALIKQMEDARGKFVLILAGYEKEMKELMQSNPGFLSRVKEYFYFESYSVDELSEIFHRMAKTEGYDISPEADKVFREKMETARHDYHFGNARTVRNVLEKSMDRHSLNFKRGISPERMRLDAPDIVYEAVSLAQW